MVQAYRVLVTVPARIGPLGHGSSWPDIRREFGDLVEAGPLAVSMRPRWLTWSAEELTLADEALAWPATYLSDMPTRSEAVQIWAFCRATRRSLKRVLRTRARMLRYSRIRSDTSLRRYLGPGLETLALRLQGAFVPVR